MILLPIVLTFIIGWLILMLCHQYRYLNSIEWVPLSFGVGLSVSVCLFFLQAVIFNTMSIRGPVIVSLALLILCIYQVQRKHIVRQEIRQSCKGTLTSIREQYIGLLGRKRRAVLGMVIYAIAKIVMTFMINTHMPTYDEDATVGRDMKTKIFVQHHNLELDPTSPEFVGTAPSRIIYSPIVDTRLLSGSDVFDGYSNIISPIAYMLSIILLRGFLYKNFGLLIAALGGYIFASLPFMFIQGIGSYRNIVFGLFLCMFGIYMVEWFQGWIRRNSDMSANRYMPIVLGCLSFIVASVRNEGLYLMVIVVICSLCLYYKTMRAMVKNFDRRPLSMLLILISGGVISFVGNEYIKSLESGETEAHLAHIVDSNPIHTLLTNIQQPGVFVAPFNQAFFHPDFNILYLVLIVAIAFMLWQCRSSLDDRLKHYSFHALVLLIITVVVLYLNLELFGLISHLVYIRYAVSFTLYLVLILAYVVGQIYTHDDK